MRACTYLKCAKDKFSLFVAIQLVSVACYQHAYANPELSQVVSGNVVIKQAPNTTEIQQDSMQAIINWRSFNIAQGEKTHFNQQAGAIALNRIDPNQGISQIFGQLTATGKIILVNAAGIHFGPNAFVDVGGLIASTSDIRDEDFLANKYSFNQPSAYHGMIINEGTIKSADYGLIALAGNGVDNQGLLEASLGNVVLASGNKFTLDFYGDQLINFSVTEEINQPSKNQQGEVVKSAINNNGTILADGGKVVVTARAAQGVLDHAINMEGVVQANSVSTKRGEIILSSNGAVKIAGRMSASSKQGKGGTIKVSGKQVKVASTAAIEANGANGGGDIWIGGGFFGKGLEQNALTTAIDAGAVINANALTNGSGGNIAIWSDGATYFHGTVSATGGSEGGNGGFVETSGHFLNVTGGKVNLLANKGKTGTWLLDPTDIIITDNAGADSNIGINSGVYTVQDDVLAVSIIDVANLTAALASSDIVVMTGDSTGSGSGDITVDAPISWGGSNSLTLSAYRNININAAVENLEGGNLTLHSASSGAGAIYLNGNAPQINLVGGGSLTFNGDLQLGTAASINVEGTLTAGNIFGNNNSLSLTNGGSISVIDSLNDLASFTYAGNGTLTLTGAGSNLGNITVNGGILALTSAQALGASANDAIIVNDNGTLSLNLAGATLENTSAMTLSGSGYGGMLGALYIGSDANLQNEIAFGPSWNSTTVIGIAGNANLTLLGSIQDTFNSGASLSIINPDYMSNAKLILQGNVGGAGLAIAGLLTNPEITLSIEAANIDAFQQNYQGAVLIGADTMLSSGSSFGSISFSRTIDSKPATSYSLTLNTDNVFLNGNIGDTTPLSQLDITGYTSLQNINGTINISTSGDQVYHGPVNMLTNANITSTEGSITFENAIDADFSSEFSNLMTTSATGISFLGVIGSSRPLTGIEVQDPTKILISAPISTFLDQTYLDAITLGSDVFLNTYGDINTSSIDGGGHALTINNMSNNSIIGELTNLTSFYYSGNGAGSLLLKGDVSTEYDQTYTDAIYIGGNLSLTSANGIISTGLIAGSNANLIINGAGNSMVSGISDLNSLTYAGTTDSSLTLLGYNDGFYGAINIDSGTLLLTDNLAFGNSNNISVKDGGTLQLSLGGYILSNTSTITLSGNGVNGVGALYVDQDAILQNNIVLAPSSNNTTSIGIANNTTLTLAGTIQAPSTNVALSIINPDAAGNANLILQGTVGNNGEILAGLSTNAEVILAAETNSIMATQQAYYGKVLIGADANFSSGNSMGLGSINFYDQVDAEPATWYSLALSSDAISFANNIGENAPLYDLTIAGATVVNNAFGNFSITTEGNQIYHSPLYLMQNTFLTANAGFVQFDGTIDQASNASSSNLNITSGGSVTFLGVVGSQLKIDNLDVTGAAGINISNAIATNFDQNYYNAILLGADTSLVAGRDISAGNVDGSGYALTLVNANNNSSIGSIINASSVTYSASGMGSMNLLGDISTINDQTYQNALVLGNNISLNSANGKIVADNITSLNNYDLAIISAGDSAVSSLSGLNSLAYTGGVGSLTLSGANTSYQGETVVNSGTLILKDVNALGDINGGSITVNDGGSLALDFVSDATLANISNIHLSGLGVGGGGTLLSGSGALTALNSATLQNTIILHDQGAPAWIKVGVTNGKTLTLAGMVEAATNNQVALGLQNISGTGEGKIILGGGVSSVAAKQLTDLATLNAATTLEVAVPSIAVSSSQDYRLGKLIITGDTVLAGAEINLNEVQGSSYDLNLLGNNSVNQFSLSGSLSVKNIMIDGGIGNTNTLEISSANPILTWSITGEDAGNLQGLSELNGSFTFTNIQNLISSNKTNIFTLNGGSITGSIQGSSKDMNSSNKIIAGNGSNTWYITDIDSGTVTGVNSFSGIQHLQGGATGNNTFILSDAAYVTGSIKGSNVSSANTVNFTAYSSLINATLTADYIGNVRDGSGGLLINFSNINNLVANNAYSNTIKLEAITKPNTLSIKDVARGLGVALNTVDFEGFRVFLGAENNNNNTNTPAAVVEHFPQVINVITSGVSPMINSSSSSATSTITNNNSADSIVSEGNLAANSNNGAVGNEEAVNDNADDNDPEYSKLLAAAEEPSNKKAEAANMQIKNLPLSSYVIDNRIKHLDTALRIMDNKVKETNRFLWLARQLIIYHDKSYTISMPNIMQRD